MIFILVTKFGINIAFTLCYIINAEYFPSIVCSRVFGVCNIFSRISTVLSPLIAEIPAPYPMVIYVFVCTVNMVASTLLKKNEDADEALKELDESISQHSKIAGSIMVKSVGGEEDDMGFNQRVNLDLSE